MPAALPRQSRRDLHALHRPDQHALGVTLRGPRARKCAAEIDDWPKRWQASAVTITQPRVYMNRTSQAHMYAPVCKCLHVSALVSTCLHVCPPGAFNVAPIDPGAAPLAPTRSLPRRPQGSQCAPQARGRLHCGEFPAATRLSCNTPSSCTPAHATATRRPSSSGADWTPTTTTASPCKQTCANIHQHQGL